MSSAKSARPAAVPAGPPAPQSPESPPPSPPSSADGTDDRLVAVGRIRRLLMTPEVGAGGAAVLVFIGFTLVSPVFATQAGIANFLDPAATMGIMAIAVALLMIGGEFDLSTGVMTGSTALVTALAVTQLNMNVWFGIGLSLVFALVVGAINGVMVHLTKLPSFIVTLGMMFVLWGLNYAVTQRLTGQVTVSGVSQYSGFDSADALFGSAVGPFQISLVWWLVLTVIGSVVLLRSVWGNWVFAIGGNADAARAVGVPVMKVRVGLFMTTAAAAWLVGTLTVIRYGNATVTSGIGLEFYFIIAAVIGGCLLTGGAGSVIGASLGALIFGMVQQGMPLVGLPSEFFRTILGLVLLAAVLVNLWIKKRALKVT
ncbi:ABC transporter permease [Brachybacterium sp. UNK5269]|uniref:ABC transporter permease n=1 Tax=Brachybacterium sp. UNK5269 TaxID=3408576 RepID=UPI003BB1954E